MIRNHVLCTITVSYKIQLWNYDAMGDLTTKSGTETQEKTYNILAPNLETAMIYVKTRHVYSDVPGCEVLNVDTKQLDACIIEHTW